jgi:hypothetical protein
MMDRMGDAKQLWPVHPAMRPVKPCVMRREVEQHGNRQPPERIAVHILIYSRPAQRLPAPGDHAGGHAINQRRQQRPADFAPHLPFQPAIQARLAHPRRQRKAAARQQIAYADNGAHRQSGQDDGCDHEDAYTQDVAPVKAPKQGRGVGRPNKREADDRRPSFHRRPIQCGHRADRERALRLRSGAAPGDSCPASAPIWCETPARRARGRPQRRRASLRCRNKIRSRQSWPRAGSFPAWSC